jgi:hypothetical protein
MNWKFHIPDLKVGTLDQLVGLSDDLGNNSACHFLCPPLKWALASLIKKNLLQFSGFLGALLDVLW